MCRQRTLKKLKWRWGQHEAEWPHLFWVSRPHAFLLTVHIRLRRGEAAAKQIAGTASRQSLLSLGQTPVPWNNNNNNNDFISIALFHVKHAQLRCTMPMNNIHTHVRTRQKHLTSKNNKNIKNQKQNTLSSIHLGSKISSRPHVRLPPSLFFLITVFMTHNFISLLLSRIHVVEKEEVCEYPEHGSFEHLLFLFFFEYNFFNVIFCCCFCKGLGGKACSSQSRCKYLMYLTTIQSKQHSNLSPTVKTQAEHNHNWAWKRFSNIGRFCHRNYLAMPR